MANDRDFLLDKDGALVNYALNNDFAKVDTPSSVALKDLAKNLNMDLATFKNIIHILNMVLLLQVRGIICIFL